MIKNVSFIIRLMTELHSQKLLELLNIDTNY